MGNRLRSFLIWKVFTSLLEQAALVAVVLWGLPQVDVHLPPWVLVPASVALTAYNVFTYRKVSQALNVRPLAGLPDMVGTRGKAVGRLNPAGQVRIRGELWSAEAESGELTSGMKVVVVGQTGLRLVVRETDRDRADSPADNARPEPHGR